LKSGKGRSYKVGFPAITGSKLRKNIDYCTILRYFNKHHNDCMRRITLIIIIFTISIFLGKIGFSQEKTSISKVVIDAGHGGKDPGTIGKKSQEKNVTLQIALKLAEEIRSQCKGVTVICTRTTDEFIELHERAEIANRSKADLFISIHCNANPKHTFQGAETYVMGLHRTEANLEIAKKENAAILLEPDYSTNYNGFDPNSDESYITFTLFQNAFLEQSTRFASIVQDEMKDRVGMNDRGVRQAGFLVLYKTTMPSVLIETGFLSNPDEEKFLTSEKGQQYIASAICRAFRKFKARMEGNGKELASLNDRKLTSANRVPTITNEVKLTNANPDQTNENIPQKDTSQPKGKTVYKIVRTEPVRPADKQNTPTTQTNQVDTPKVHNVKKNISTPKEHLAVNEVKQPSVNKKLPVNNTLKTESVPKTTGNQINDVVFRIQIATSPKEISLHAKKFAGLPEIWSYQHQGTFKYTTGKESSPEALSGLLAEARKAGFTDAFVVAFHAGERITIAEAKQLIEKKK
jgi:N-acetylmuramoyl-L-alanine amidase